MNTYIEKRRLKIYSARKQTPSGAWLKKKSFDATKSPAPFSKLDKIPRFTGSDVTMARIIRTAEPTSWPLPPVQYPRVSPGAHPLTKKPEDSGYEIGWEWCNIWVSHSGHCRRSTEMNNFQCAFAYCSLLFGQHQNFVSSFQSNKLVTGIFFTKI